MQFRWNGVSERDMDLLFLEEFALNEDFLNLFLQKTGNAELFSYKIVSEEVSLTDAVLGESDLTIVLEKDGRNVALLIENKIHAIARPRQYERYVERGEKAGPECTQPPVPVRRSGTGFGAAALNVSSILNIFRKCRTEK